MRGRDLLLVLAATATGAALIALSSPNRVDAPLRTAGRAAEAEAPPGDAPEPPLDDRSEPAVSGRFGEWNWIVVHHTGEPAGDLASLDAKHRKELGYEDGLAFHFLVGSGNGLALGAVAEGSRFARSIPGPHCTEIPGVSLASIGVAAIGDTAAAPLPGEEMRALGALVESLRARLGLPRERVLLHREVEGGDATCPGPLFDAAAFRAAMDAEAERAAEEEVERR